ARRRRAKSASRRLKPGRLSAPISVTTWERVAPRASRSTCSPNTASPGARPARAPIPAPRPEHLRKRGTTMERGIIAWPPDEVKRSRSGPGLGTYVRPWATTLGLIPAGWAAHAAWGDAGLTTGLAAAGITAAGACVTWLSWRLCRARTWYAALVAPATAGGITAWLATATITRPGRPWLDLLIV